MLECIKKKQNKHYDVKVYQKRQIRIELRKCIKNSNKHCKYKVNQS